jgi:hypothetical protein
MEDKVDAILMITYWVYPYSRMQTIGNEAESSAFGKIDKIGYACTPVPRTRVGDPCGLARSLQISTLWLRILPINRPLKWDADLGASRKKFGLFRERGGVSRG